MVARAFLMTAVAIALCACASTVPQRTNLQNAVYMVGDNAPLVKSSAAPGAMEREGEFSVVAGSLKNKAGR
jgi:hypothetical protein